MGFPGGSAVKNLPANPGDGVRSLCQEDPLEKERVLVPRGFWACARQEERILFPPGTL